jgi:hypothetical protein
VRPRHSPDHPLREGEACAAGRAQKSFRNEATHGWRFAEPYGCAQVQEWVVADQNQSRVSSGLSISVMNAAVIRPTAAILKERGTICGVLPFARPPSLQLRA